MMVRWYDRSATAKAEADVPHLDLATSLSSSEAAVATPALSRHASSSSSSEAGSDGPRRKRSGTWP